MADSCADVEAVPNAVAIRNDLEETVELTTNLLLVERLQPGDVSHAVLSLVSEIQQCIMGVAEPVDAGFTVK